MGNSPASTLFLTSPPIKFTHFSKFKMSNDKPLESFNFLSGDNVQPFSFLTSDKKEDSFSFLSSDSTESTNSGFNFTFNSTATTEDKNKEDDDEDGPDDKVAEEEECKASFEPLVKLEDFPEIELKTNEEDEDILYSVRAKIFRFVSETNEWKERGFGILKFLKHKTTGKVRVLMRRDKTLKICANHYFTSGMKLEPNIGSDRSWVYSTLADFSDEVSKAETFAIKLGTVDATKEFKIKFEEAQKEAVKLE
jgi:Ran-binding protein 1